MTYYTLKWKNGRVSMLDQRLLPQKEIYRNYSDYKKVVRAIKDMTVRGAPAIGVAGALGIALAVKNFKKTAGELRKKFKGICREFRKTRPTAVNLFWAIDRMEKRFAKCSSKPLGTVRREILDEAMKIYKEDVEACRALTRNGQRFIKNNSTILTHCNAGPLATAGYGTALGVIIRAKKQGKRIRVFADETRPRLQGAKLTAWELLKNGVNAVLISDNMAASIMAKGKIDLVITGADRIASNGDSANKIGTYSLAVLASHHGIPFYIAAPLSTIDLKCRSGAQIPIEEREHGEVTSIGGVRIAPKGIKVFNPAFDVTPARYIKAIITENGVARPPFGKSLKKLFKVK